MVASGKGGVGKSTVSSTLGLYLHRKGYNIIMIDADADAPNLHLIFNVESWEGEEELLDSWVASIDYARCTDCGVCAKACAYKAISLVDGKYVIDPIVCEGCLTCALACPERAIRRHKTRMGYIRWGRTRYGFPLYSSELSVGRPNSGKLVTEIKNRAKEKSDKNHIFVTDSAAGIGCQVISSFAGGDAAILVAEPTPSSFSDLKRVHTVAKQFMLPAGLVINKYDLNEDYAQIIEDYALKEGMDILGRIPYDESVPKSMSMLQPVTVAFPSSPASKALLEIASRIEERVVRNYQEWRRKHKPRKITPYYPLMVKD